MKLEILDDLEIKLDILSPDTINSDVVLNQPVIVIHNSGGILLSQKAGNILTKEADGLYAAPTLKTEDW